MELTTKYQTGLWYPRSFKDKFYWSEIPKKVVYRAKTLTLEEKVKAYLRATEGE